MEDGARPTGEAGTPAFSDSDFFDRVSDQDVRRLLGPGWAREDVRLQAAWQFARQGHHAESVAAAFGLPLPFARLLVDRAEEVIAPDSGD